MDIEIRWHGRGGQGLVTANEILAETAITAGKYVKAFPEFGPERMGAPIRGFTRISEKPILVHSQVYEPDIVIVMDGTLVGKVDVALGTKKDSVILANYAGSPKELQEALMTDVECHTLDANKISIEEIGKPMVNTVMLGALIGVRELVPYDLLEDQITNKFTGKLSDKVIVKNLSALKRGYKEVQRMAMANIKDLVIGGRIIQAGNSEKFFTGDWRSFVPVVDQDKCIDCYTCWIYCPDNSIVFRDDKMSGIKISHCKGCGICAKVCPKGAITMKEE